MAWQRARQPAQKEHRRATILAAAARLFDTQRFERITLGAIAESARISKSDLYRYFESKEEIFLLLLTEDLHAWVDGIESSVIARKGNATPETIARAMLSQLARHPRMPALASVAGAVLEQNVSAEAAARFKAVVLEITARSANVLHAAIPELTIDKARQIMGMVHALVMGLWQMANPAPIVKAVIERPELRALRVDFEKELCAATALLIRGALAERPG